MINMVETNCSKVLFCLFVFLCLRYLLNRSCSYGTLIVTFTGCKGTLGKAR